MNRKKRKVKWIILFVAVLSAAAFAMDKMLLYLKAADYEAKIGDTYYETLEEAFEGAGNGSTITVLKDCRVSKTLVMTKMNVTLKSEDAEHPAVISRDTDFAGEESSYGNDFLMEINTTGFVTEDIIFDGGAVVDENLVNTGQSWESALIETGLECTFGNGTVLRNNYNVSETEDGNNGQGGALHIDGNDVVTFNGALIENCYASSEGGGVYIGTRAVFKGNSGTIRNCSSEKGGAVRVFGTGVIKNMTFTGNRASQDGGALHVTYSLSLSDSVFEENTADGMGGAVAYNEALSREADIERCTFRDNEAQKGSAIQVIAASGSGSKQLAITDCSFSGNRMTSGSTGSGTVDYQHEGGILLDGSIVMDGSVSGDGSGCSIMMSYKKAGPVILGENFSSASVFPIGCIPQNKEILLVNAETNQIETDTTQFPWYQTGIQTKEKEDGNIYSPVIYTVTFDPMGGECEKAVAYVEAETSTILPSCSREGYELVSWCRYASGTYSVGKAGESYTPTKNITLYAGWKEIIDPAECEARIGTEYYKTVEEAFDALKAGDTVYILKDCGSSKTLEVKVSNVTVCSEDADAPAVISRDAGFTGKAYGQDAGNVLFGITSGSAVTENIIFDGGAVVDENLENTGEFWDSPLIYVKKTYTMKTGTVLRNNYNGDEAEYGDYRTGGAVHVAGGGTFSMDGGMIENCHTSGEGGGILAVEDSVLKISSGTIKNCSAANGGGIEIWAPAEIKGVIFSGNKADVDGGAVYSSSELEISDCRFTGNTAGHEGGGTAVSIFYDVSISDSTFTGNEALSGSAIGATGTDDEKQLVVADCSFKDNKVTETSGYGSIINYGHKGGILLDGSIVMEDNLLRDGKDSDILLFDTDTGAVVLGNLFESSSVFLMGCRLPESGMLLVDASANGIETDEEQFVWYNETYRTVEAGGDIYLADPVEIYTITFYVNGGECSESTAEVEENASITLPSCSKEDQVFAGWYEDEACTVLAGKAGESYTPSSDVTLYAGWEEKEDVSGNDPEPEEPGDVSGNDPEPEEPTEYNITFDAGEGSCEEGMARTVNGMVTLPDCTCEGYDFTGWYEDEACTVLAGKAGESYTPSSDVTLYAGWEEKEDVSGNDPEPEEPGDVSGNDPEPEEPGDVSGNDPEPEEPGDVSGNDPEPEEPGDVSGNDPEPEEPGDISGNDPEPGENNETGTDDKDVPDNGEDKAASGNGENSGTGNADGYSPDSSNNIVTIRIVPDVETAEPETGPFLQTGHFSPVPAFMVSGICGFCLMMLSYLGKRKTKWI